MTNKEFRELLLQLPDDAEVYAFNGRGILEEIEGEGDIEYMDEDNTINIKWQ